MSGIAAGLADKIRTRIMALAEHEVIADPQYYTYEVGDGDAARNIIAALNLLAAPGVLEHLLKHSHDCANNRPLRDPYTGEIWPMREPCSCGLIEREKRLRQDGGE